MIYPSDIKSHDLDINICNLQLLYIPLFYPPYSEALGMKLNSVGDVMIHPSEPTNYGLNTNFGHFQLFFVPPLPTSRRRVAIGAVK